MRPTAFAAALSLLAAAAAPAAADLGPLVTPEELAAALAGDAPIVLDIRAPEAADGAPAYAAGHVPGALNAPYGLFRGPAENPGRLPEPAALTELLRSLGLSEDSAVVVVHQGRDATDFGAAARVYWTLKSAGLEELSILNGGVAAWTEAGLPLSTEAPAAPAPSDLELNLSDRWLATEADVLAVVEGRDEALLLDARPEAFWNGEKSHPAAARPGTLPQSRYFEQSRWFGGGAAIVDAEAARSLAAREGLDGADQLVSFCNTGHWAATNWFALSELAGIENVKLYPESMVGWSNAGRAMANVPGPLRHLIDEIADAVGASAR